MSTAMRPRWVRLEAPQPFTVWRVDLAFDAMPDEIAQLAPAERDRATRFVFERDRRRYLAAHCALRRLLAQRCGQPPQSLAYEIGPFGKPRLAGAPRCSFSMSHSGDVALVGIADGGEIGIDLEVLRPMGEAQPLAQHNYTPAECAELAAAADRDLAFLRCWTRKEACLKAIGSGFSIAPHIFEVGLSPAPRTVTVPAGAQRVEVRVQSLRHETDVVAAVAELL